MVICLVVVAAMVLGIGFTLIKLISGYGGTNAYVLLSDDEYLYLPNLKKDTTIGVGASRSETDYGYTVSFSPDGKFFYFITKYNAENNSGTLCRAEYGKLKENSSKNANYIETIDSDVHSNLRVLDDGSLLYWTGSFNLNYFDGEESFRVGREVSKYEVYGSDKIVFLTGVDEDGHSGNLYCANFDDIDNKAKISSDVETFYPDSRLEHIFYTKISDDGRKALYISEFAKAGEKLADDASIVAMKEDTLYYTASNGASVSLYDFVEDLSAEEDAAMTEPNIESFQIPTYRYEMIRGTDLVESNYHDLYTSCTKPLYMYGESGWSSYSMEDAIKRDWGDGSQGFVEATRNFIDRFADNANEDGYIKVTDEVKAALLNIKANSDPEDEWLWLCYNRTQSGSSTDYEAYNAEKSKWSEVQRRNDLREALRSEEYTLPLHTLYRYEEDTQSVIDDTVLSTPFSFNLRNSAVEYLTTDALNGRKISIEEIESYVDVQSWVSDRLIEKFDLHFLVLENGSICTLPCGTFDSLLNASNDNADLMLFTSREVFWMNNGFIYCAPIEDGVVGQFSVLTQDAGDPAYCELDGSTLYYGCDTYDIDGKTYCDLYSYADGKIECLARDILTQPILLYDDGILLAYTDYREGFGFELTMIDSSGEATRIAEDVTEWFRVDKSTILYLADSDLYLYHGKNKEMVRSNVEQLWCKDFLKAEHTLFFDFLKLYME